MDIAQGRSVSKWVPEGGPLFPRPKLTPSPPGPQTNACETPMDDSEHLSRLVDAVRCESCGREPNDQEAYELRSFAERNYTRTLLASADSRIDWQCPACAGIS